MESKLVRRKFNEKFYWLKYRFNDFTWNRRGIVVPIATFFGGVVWFCMEPAPEPMVVLVTSLLAGLMWQRESDDSWYTCSQGTIYKTYFRCDLDTTEKRIKDANDFVDEFSFIFKKQVIPNGGDTSVIVVLDVLFNDSEKFIEIARKHGYVTRIWQDGKEIYEGGC